MSIYAVDKLISQARQLAKEYRTATGKTLPITGEIAINDAIRLLEMEQVSELNKGYDAVLDYEGRRIRVQIKGRAIVNAKRSDHRLGQLRMDREWDAIMLVIMDADYDTREIYLAEREAVEEAIAESRNRRGSISVARCKIIGALLWTAEDGVEQDGC